MKRKLSHTSFCILFLLIITPLLSRSEAGKAAREFYQLTVYYYNNNEQEQVLDKYLQQALLPALHKMKIANVGVFKSISNDTATLNSMYVLVPGKSLEMLKSIPGKLSSDAAYQAAGSDYINAGYKTPPYARMEVVLLQAFSLAPKMQPPALKGERKERIYELRSYESATEKIFANKVQMFNEGDEIGLFKRLNFNAIFYGEVIAGSKMPNLMYMTSFENKADRDAHWKSFVDDPYWKKLSAMPEYQHNVSHIDIMFLRPTEYSDY